MLNILIADDHSIVVAGLKIIIAREYPLCRIDSAGRGDEVFKLVKENNYDLAIIDINMPGTDITNLFQQLLLIKKKLRILVFSMYPEDFYAKRFLKIGVKGYLSKEASNEEISKAIQTVLDDKLYISDKVMIKFSESVLGNIPDNIFETLSERELEVTRHLCNGLRLHEICELMNLHTSTISTHKAKIFQKLGVKTTIELKKLAYLNNIIF